MTPDSWCQTTLEQVADIAIGKTPARNEKSYWDPGKTTQNRWATIADIKSKFIGETTEYISDLGVQHSNARLVPEGTLLMSFKLSLGRAAITSTSMYTNEAIAAFYPNGLADTEYLYYLLPTLALEESSDRAVKGRTLNKTKLRALQLVLPPTDDQRKIAAILSSVDDAIEKTRAVIDQVQVVKRGLMQELLTRGLPGRHTRFKQTEIGEIPKEWDADPLGNGAELQPGFPFKSRDFAAGGDRLLRGSNVGVSRLVWTEDKTKYFPSARRAEVKDYELRDGDIVVAMDRPFVSDGFKVSRVTADDLPALLLQRVGRFRRYRGLTPGYLWQLLQSGYVQGHLKNTQKGTDLPHVSRTEIESAVCPLPPVDEQESIARCLDTFDAYSTRLERERRQATRLKTGLMAVLLTGEIRVTPDPENA